MSPSITRRGFLKAAALATVTAPLAGCRQKKDKEGFADSEAPEDSMTLRTISRTGDAISVLGYGCMRFPMKGEGKDAAVDQERVNELIDYALAHGVNYFDTAPVYLQGLSEAAVGKALERHDRSSYFLATKLSNFMTASSPREMYERSVAMYRASLEYLKTDTIDYYLLHAIGSIEDFHTRYLDTGIIPFLQAEKASGHIRNLGCSVHCGKETFDYIMSCGIPMDFVQIQMNYYDWAIGNEANVEAEYMYQELARRGIPVVVMEPIQGGRLSRVDYAGINELRVTRPGSSAASWAFRFCGTYPGVMTVLSGMTYMEHLSENIRTFSPLEPLDEAETRTLLDTAQLMAQRPMIQCNACQYCMPCPWGLDIPGILGHYNRCLEEGNLITDPADTAYRKARRAFLIGYDRSVPRLRQAAHCAGCQECVSRCPQHLDIPQEMVRIGRFVEELRSKGPTL